MVLIIDGSSAQGAQIWRNWYISICWRHLVISKKSSNPIFFRKRPILFPTCATCSELPSYISTMDIICISFYLYIYIYLSFFLFISFDGCLCLSLVRLTLSLYLLEQLIYDNDMIAITKTGGSICLFQLLYISLGNSFIWLTG